MKHLFFIIFSLITFLSTAQNNEEWILFKTIEGVEFYEKTVACTPANIPHQIGVIIKIVNTNRYDIKAEWDIRIWYDGKEHTKDVKDAENHIIQAVKKKDSIEGKCSNPNGNLYLYKKFTTFEQSAEMTNYQLDNIVIKKE